VNTARARPQDEEIVLSMDVHLPKDETIIDATTDTM